MSRRRHTRYDDDDYYDEDGYQPRSLKLVSWVVGLGALAAFVALAWYAYHSGSATYDPAQAELIAADSSPYKEVPKDPGGWQAPHRDKSIYEVIEGKGNQPAAVAERLTPAPEEPMDVPTTSSSSSTWMNAKLRDGASDVPLTDAERQKAEKPAEKTPEAPKAVTQAVAEAAAAAPQAPVAAPIPIPTPAPSPAPAAVVKPVPVAPVATKPAKPKVEKLDTEAAPAKPKPVVQKVVVIPSGGKPRVQLGAFRSPSEAAAHVKHLSKRVDGVLNGKQTTVEHVDLGAKGVYYRLFALPYGTREEAVQACARIKAARLDCMVK